MSDHALKAAVLAIGKSNTDLAGIVEDLPKLFMRQLENHFEVTKDLVSAIRESIAGVASSLSAGIAGVTEKQNELYAHFDRLTDTCINQQRALDAFKGSSKEAFNLEFDKVNNRFDQLWDKVRGMDTATTDGLKDVTELIFQKNTAILEMIGTVEDKIGVLETKIANVPSLIMESRIEAGANHHDRIEHVKGEIEKTVAADIEDVCSAISKLTSANEASNKRTEELENIVVKGREEIGAELKLIRTSATTGLDNQVASIDQINKIIADNSETVSAELKTLSNEVQVLQGTNKATQEEMAGWARAYLEVKEEQSSLAETLATQLTIHKSVVDGQVKAAVDKLEAYTPPVVDLTGLATKGYVDSSVADNTFYTDAAVKEVKAALEAYTPPVVDLTGLATVEYVDKSVDKVCADTDKFIEQVETTTRGRELVMLETLSATRIEFDNAAKSLDEKHSDNFNMYGEQINASLLPVYERIDKIATNFEALVPATTLVMDEKVKGVLETVADTANALREELGTKLAEGINAADYVSPTVLDQAMQGAKDAAAALVAEATATATGKVTELHEKTLQAFDAIQVVTPKMLEDAVAKVAPPSLTGLQPWIAATIETKVVELMPKQPEALPAIEFRTSMSDAGDAVDLRVYKQGEAEPVSSLSIPIRIGVQYRGVFDKYETYKSGDVVTKDGSSWICNGAATGSPGEDFTGWRMQVRAGTDGRDAKPTMAYDTHEHGRKYRNSDFLRIHNRLWQCTVKEKGGTLVVPDATQTSSSDLWTLIGGVY